jgi:hypothetical protein
MGMCQVVFPLKRTHAFRKLRMRTTAQVPARASKTGAIWRRLREYPQDVADGAAVVGMSRDQGRRKHPILRRPRKIKRVHSKYEEAWLRGDADGVRALFTEDCVLLPPHGDTPRIGQKGLNEYWFAPGAPPTGDREAGGDTAKHQRRWADRVCVGDRRSSVDNGARRQDDSRRAQRHVFECAPEAGGRRLETVAPYVG